MIEINNKKYNEYSLKISWGNFGKIVSGKQIKGQSPFIKFYINNEIFIGLEFVISKEELEIMKINESKNLKGCLSDVIYEDENGWISLITGQYSSNITKIGKDKFKLDLNIVFNEFDEIHIIIDHILNLSKE